MKKLQEKTILSNMAICLVFSFTLNKDLNLNPIRINTIGHEATDQFVSITYKLNNISNDSLMIMLDYFALKIIDDVNHVLNEHNLSNVNTVAVISTENYNKTINNRIPSNVGDRLRYVDQFPKYKALNSGESFKLQVNIPVIEIDAIENPVYFLKLKYGDLKNLDTISSEQRVQSEYAKSEYVIEISESLSEIEKKGLEQSTENDGESFFLRSYFDKWILIKFLPHVGIKQDGLGTNEEH